MFLVFSDPNGGFSALKPGQNGVAHLVRRGVCLYFYFMTYLKFDTFKATRPYGSRARAYS